VCVESVSVSAAYRVRQDEGEFAGGIGEKILMEMKWVIDMTRQMGGILLNENKNTRKEGDSNVIKIIHN
jgi:hypothetical protein